MQQYSANALMHIVEVTNTISYEQPLNERVRTLLRLEQLMVRFHYHAEKETPWDTHTALATLLEIFALSTRGDLKNDLMKELERQIANLSRLAQDPDVDQPSLQRIIGQQRQIFEKLHEMQGQLGQHLKNNDFIGSLRQRAVLPGGTCDFDLPAYHFWLSQEHGMRQQQLEAWIAPYEQVMEAVRLILSLIRESAEHHERLAERGFYQQALDPAQPYQLLRIELPKDVLYFPEISAGKHRFSIRFLLQTDINSRARQTEENIPFTLCCCAL